MFSAKVNLPPLNGPVVLSSASDKAKLLAKNFPTNSDLDDSGTSLPVFPSRTYLKLPNISDSSCRTSCYRSKEDLCGLVTALTS